MSLRSLRKHLISLMAVTISINGLAVSLYAQAGLPASKPANTHVAVAPRKTTTIYEDAEITVVIPRNWKIVPHDEIAKNGSASVSLGNSVTGGNGKVILEKSGYTLGIAYNTGHASGIEGGRFIEIFNIPWPEVDDAWTCSLYFAGYVQPASRMLTFTNLIVDSGNSKVQENCGIRKDLGRWTEKDGSRFFEGERRWFGGYFTTADGAYLFDSKGAGCGQKAYTLTFQAKAPDRLPVVGDPGLKKMIQEAIDIVDSIHYKRCPPESAP